MRERTELMKIVSDLSIASDHLTEIEKDVGVSQVASGKRLLKAAIDVLCRAVCEEVSE